MKLRYKLSLLIIGLMLVGCLFVTQSYALWIMTEEQTNENEMEVGCFSIGFSEQSESIKLDNTYPVNDSIGLSTNPYTFTITNTCTINNNYVLTLNTLSTNTLDASKIKYALYKSTEEKPNVGSKLSRINNDLENLMVENLGTSYIIDTGVLTGGTKVDGVVNNGEEVTYNLYLWIDDIAGNEVEGQSFEASINVINAATESNDIGEAYGSAVAKCGAEGKDAVTCMKESANLDTINLAYDGKESLGEELGTDDNNLRYIGSNPNNYIDIGDRDAEGQPILWRIIGVMNNITSLDNGEHQESLLKIMRSDSIGGYSWDTSTSDVNGGYGVNEWSQADIMKLLNPNDVYIDKPTIGASLYWNRGSGSCYYGQNEVANPCNFTSNGISEEANKKIAKVKWNTGTTETINDFNKINSRYLYESERSSHDGKENCLSNSGNFCNDNIDRTTLWNGYIGLMYPSDYGYAVGGTARNDCVNKSLHDYNNGICSENDWLKPNSGISWTMTPVAYSSHAIFVYAINSLGSIQYIDVYAGYSEYPVAYLKSNTKIISGNGIIDNPFILEN